MPRRRERMAIVAIFAAALVTVGADSVPRPSLQTAHPNEVTLLYVGADDCAPCRSWQRGAGLAFRASPEFSRVSFREVKSPTVLDLLADRFWPDDLRKYRSRLARDAGVPLWFVIADDEIVEQCFGESEWGSAVLPKLKSLLQ